MMGRLVVKNTNEDNGGKEVKKGGNDRDGWAEEKEGRNKKKLSRPRIRRINCGLWRTLKFLHFNDVFVTNRPKELFTRGPDRNDCLSSSWQYCHFQGKRSLGCLEAQSMIGQISFILY